MNGVSNVEIAPAEMVCGDQAPRAAAVVEILTPRAVPLGGPRAMSVRRTLPQRARSGAPDLAPQRRAQRDDRAWPRGKNRARRLDMRARNHTGRSRSRQIGDQCRLVANQRRQGRREDRLIDLERLIHRFPTAASALK